MDDLISRQAVLEQTYNWSRDEFLRTTNAFDHLRRKIKALPSVQPEQNIIRCKECRFYTNFQKGKPWNVSNKYCNRVVTIKTSPDDFCSFAKAKMESEVRND